MADRVVLVLCFGIVAISAPLFFIPGISAPYAIGFVLLAGLFLLPIVGELVQPLRRWCHAVLTVLGPAFAKLVVVDPVEIGFYGYDPYLYTLPSYRVLSEAGSISDYVAISHSWPGYYPFLETLVVLTGLPVTTIGKYAPMLTALTPLFLYLALNRLTTRHVAFLATMGFASTRTLITFQSKFIDQTLAITVLFGIVLALTIYTRASNQALKHRLTFVMVPMIVLVNLTHHVTAAFLAILLGTWLGVDLLVNSGWLPRRLNTRRVGDLPSISLVAVAVIAFTTMFSFVAVGSLDNLLVSVIEALTEGQTKSDPTEGPATRSSHPLRQLVTTTSIPVLAAFAAIAAWGVLSRTRLESWVSSWTAYAGLIATIYAISMVGGKAINLDPIRFLLILVATLIAPALVVLRGQDVSPLSGWRAIVAGILLSLLVITQLAAVPPHVLYSNPGNTSTLEGHYTPQQFAASEWAGTHSERQIVALEAGLWYAGGTTDVHWGYVRSCEDRLRVWRAESGLPLPSNASVIYDAGDVSLYLCDT